MKNNIDFLPDMLGEQLGIGATAAVYAYGVDKIIKIFQKRFSRGHVEGEYQCSKMAEWTTLPVPENFGMCEVTGTGNPELDGCYGVIQERVYGISVMDKVMQNPSMEACSSLITDLVALQVRMHGIEADRIEPDRTEADRTEADRTEADRTEAGRIETDKVWKDFWKQHNQKDILHRNISWAPLLSEAEKEQLYAVLEQLPSGNRICHGDYHMGNVLLTGKGMVCIDWCDVTCGNPTADLARSLLIFRCEGVPDSIPPEVVELTIKMRDICWDFYLQAYRELGGVYDHLEEWLAVVAAARLFCEVEDNRQSMLRVVREYLNRKNRSRVIETERLILREMTEDDYDALYAVLADSDIMQHYPYTFDEARVRGWITKNIERYRTFGFGLWAVVLKETGEMIGDCGLIIQLIGGQMKPEIGYHIRKDCQRKGYGSEAARASRDWTFEHTPFNIVYSYMKYTNVGSYSTAIANGMHQVDEFEDEVNTITKVYAITREEWIGLQK